MNYFQFGIAYSRVWASQGVRQWLERLHPTAHDWSEHVNKIVIFIYFLNTLHSVVCVSVWKGQTNFNL